MLQPAHSPLLAVPATNKLQNVPKCVHNNPSCGISSGAVSLEFAHVTKMLVLVRLHFKTFNPSSLLSVLQLISFHINSSLL